MLLGAELQRKRSDRTEGGFHRHQGGSDSEYFDTCSLQPRHGMGFLLIILLYLFIPLQVVNTRAGVGVGSYIHDM